MLWQAEELIAATGGEMRGEDEGAKWGAQGLSIDSREIQDGDLFIALKAARDGHEFVKIALDNGAAGALVSYIPEGLENANLLLVDNVEDALAKLAVYRRGQVHAKIVAITGSAGKTSTKEMLIAAARAEFQPLHASVKSFNNHWGVPLSLARMPKDTKLGIFEIGMNHPGEIAPLVAMVKPDIAVITNIASVHLAGFEDERGIAREKASILTGLGANGLGIVFGDMMYHAEMKDAFSGAIRYYGADSGNEVKLLSTDLDAHGSKARAALRGGEITYEIGEPGRHHVMNALGVLSVVEALGGDVNQAIEGLATWRAPSGRGEEFSLKIKDKPFILIDESFNANPLSMKASLSSLVLRSIADGATKIAILGDMGELGSAEKTLHAGLADLSEMAQIDRIYTVGKLMQSLYEALPSAKRGGHFMTADDVLATIADDIEAGDILMVKSSKTTGLSRLVSQLKALSE